MKERVIKNKQLQFQQTYIPSDIITIENESNLFDTTSSEENIQTC